MPDADRKFAIRCCVQIGASSFFPLFFPGPVALAQILFGEISPTGKLAYTVYPEAWANNTAMTDMALTAGDGRTYKWYKGESPAPFHFGQGMTYTTFKVAAAAVQTGCPPAALMCVAVDVTNVGATPAAEVAMMLSRAVSPGPDVRPRCSSCWTKVRAFLGSKVPKFHNSAPNSMTRPTTQPPLARAHLPCSTLGPC